MIHLAEILLVSLLGIVVAVTVVIVVGAWLVERRHDIMGDSPENDWFV